MSKSGSRYGRRSNWFKIHCLLQEQQQQHQQSGSTIQSGLKVPQKTPSPHQALSLGLLSQPFGHPLIHHINKTKEELMLLGLDEYKNSASPSVSSPESHNSDSSVEISDARRMPLFHGLLPPTFLPPHNLLFPPGYPPLYPGLLQPTNNNNRLMRNHNPGVEAFSKRVFLDAVLQSQRSPTPEVEASPSAESPIQEDPIDLSMKTLSERGSSPAHSERSDSVVTERGAGSEADEESDCDSEKDIKRIKLVRPTPLDLTTKV
jgi:nuclear receptor subfamily 0 group A